jgi:competence protein ComEA
MRLYLSRPEQYAIAVLLLAIVGALVVLTYAYARKPAGAPPPFLQQTAPKAPDATGERVLIVHVAGAVVRPGVYQLKPGQRVSDAVAAAGGATADGNLDSLNLAELVEDGRKVTVLTKAEWERAQQAPAPRTDGGKPGTPTSPGAGGKSGPAPKPAAPTPAHKLSLNTATLAQLDTLPGIGPAKAKSILDYRQKHGKFTDVAQLLDVPGIGPAIYENIALLVTL